ncbi:PIG-L family deacetylase [Streptomyces sp. HPF1205]|uniref:PIG-L family deacetylase n=1 Tax=Streptomyces sp. HPF1205 TaxID=2873262 RepID=UPI001CECA760|nr:PIG-L family deacetylase [Streptomyces sp. HPF1205]
MLSAGGPSRRGLVAAAVAVAAGAGGAVAGCGVGAKATARRLTLPDPRATQPYRETPAGQVVMNILAHPDDDLFFMNPDTYTSLRAGVPVVSVYVTAGEATGVNHEPYGPRRHHEHDLDGYSSARHQGLRQAYAAMLGLPHFTPWQREVIALGSGIPVEVDTLTSGAMTARLVFLQVSMHEWGPTASLPMMWSRSGVALPYIVAKGAPSPADKPAVWTRAKLVDALVDLMDRYGPTHIRTLDPDPDIQVHDRKHPKGSDQPGYSDHRDHTAAALFAWKAMDEWVARSAAKDGTVPRFTSAAYRGYYNQRWPKNLPPATVALKARFLYQYGGNMAWHCGNPSGCGDYGQGENEPLTNHKGWIRSTHPRYPGTRTAIADTPGGRTAFEVLGLRAVRRTETRPGVWGPAQDLGGGPLAPALSCVRTPDGTVRLFALRFASLEGHGGRNARDIVVWSQGPGWRSLGNPEPDDDRGRRVGSPVALLTPDGRVHLFVRNAARGLSERVLADGRWTPWRNLRGGEVQEGLAALTDASGRIHVFGAGHVAVHHWAQDVPGGPVAYRPLKGLPLPGDIPAARRSGTGVELSYPHPASGRRFRRDLVL